MGDTQAWKNMYIPMTMGLKEARTLIREHNVSSEAISEIEKILYREKVTPLQAQAILTEAWHWVISQGRIADRMK